MKLVHFLCRSIKEEANDMPACRNQMHLLIEVIRNFQGRKMALLFLPILGLGFSQARTRLIDAYRDGKDA